MQFGCRRPVTMVSQGVSRSNTEMCPTFPPPQTAHVTAPSKGRGALGSMVQQWQGKV